MGAGRRPRSRACLGDGAGRLIFAGWIPQDELFGWSVSPCLKDERDNESRCCSQLTRKCSKRCHAPDRRPAVFGEMGG